MDERFVSVAGDSPVDAAVPFWVTACLRLAPPQRRDGRVMSAAADKVLTAAQVLLADRVRSADPERVVLDRAKLARWCGYESANKAGWLLDYLSSIGFLRIDRHYVSGRRGRSVDTFTVFSRPPVGYVGPRTYAELDRALSDPTTPARLFVASPRPRPSGPVAHMGMKTGVSAGQGLDAHVGTKTGGLGAHVGMKTGVSAGQGLDAHVGTKTGGLGAHVGMKTGVSAGQGLDAHVGMFSRSIDSSPRSRRGEESIEPVPGGSAAPPATGHDDAAAADAAPDEVAALVARLPWVEWARSSKRASSSWRPTVEDLAQVQSAIRSGLDAGISLVEAAEIACAAMRDATGTQPVTYVSQAFTRHLSRWLRVIQVAPLDENPLPLHGAGIPAPPDPAPRRDSARSVAVECPGGEAPVSRSACARCGAGEGDGPGLRFWCDDDGQMRACECRPAAVAAGVVSC
ncbi:hypothetical protein [Pseudonocardia sp. ICBG1142]|uniref:hypothetical protein n=1 Tax=Pseudonocardia sp. ICBG1142 TaxID=2846760 RepID=UPI001CF699F5|nr:hypothetical protein [Pseudonocardia sp. ICBG1142]